MCWILGYKIEKMNVLPKPPVADLQTTLDRYLEYAAVVAVGQKGSLATTHAAAARFLEEAGPLQLQLYAVADESPNWVTKYWLPEMYMRVRIPTPVNSNPAYIFPKVRFKDLQEQIRYTALLTRGLLEYKNKIDLKQIEKEVSTGKQKIHLCMEQYERILNCYRQPGFEEDTQFRKPKTHQGNEHVLVMCRKQTYIMHTRINGAMLPQADIESQLTKIESISRNTVVNSLGIAACGVGERKDGAAFWEEMFLVEQNAKSFEWVKDSLFVVCLDVEDDGDSENSLDSKENIERDFVQRGIHILTGHGSGKNGLNRWYDATIQLIVARDGSNGLCIEHSTAEGIVIINMAEFAIRHAQSNFHSKLISREIRNVHPKTLTWHVSQPARKILQKQTETFDELARELELEVLLFEDFGKDAIKDWGVSPDGFAQLTLQLSHYKTHGYLVSTYESASVRRFRSGRVDNIRANTQAALEWVTAMESKSVDDKKKFELFRKAAEKQAKVTAENITGYGIDNHLCALYVLARERQKATGEEMPALFRDPLWADVMRFPLSTSQVTPAIDIPDSYLCYGAVVRDGYGCAYAIHPQRLLFAPSAFRSDPRTDLPKFKRMISASLRQIRDLIKANT
ncbi:unnamed protein product [Caenorhabditis auriculariae]|uniref:Choline O-acetyltransferase n=1 Tax=Caenorhabditis auriculariae TaxID=2777116 RepID=A0A8S1HJS1_9PELO|nr:unnamed protein product [Caenorhabditis auriculariae]